MPSVVPLPAARSPRVPFGPRITRTEVLLLAAAVLAVSLYPVLPAALWLSPFFLAGACVAIRIRALERPERLWLAGCAAAGCLLQIGVTLALQPYDPVHGPTDWFDDQAYFRSADSIARAWKKGFFPELSRKGDLPYLGTLHTGYERVLASVFYVGGPRVWLGLAVNVLCSALLPVLCYLLAASLFREAGQTAGGTGRSGGWKSRLTPARTAALLCVFHPSLYYWGSMLMKDLFLATLFALSLWLLIDLIRFRSPALAVTFALTLFWTAIFRNYAALAIAAAAFVYLFAGLSRLALVWGLIWALILLLGFRYTDVGDRYLDQLLSSFGSHLPRELSTVKGVMTHFAEAVPRMILSPYAWVPAQTDRPIYGQFPGMWYLYLLVYPLALAGLVEAIRTNHRLTIIPLTAILASAFVLLAAYGGNAPRQRLYLEIVAVMYAGLGLSSVHRRRAFVLTYTAIILFAAAQLLRLYMRR